MTIRRTLMLASVFAAIVLAQFDAGTVLGTVRDSSGSVIAGAKVMLKNTATNATAVSTTDDGGNYQFLTVKIGDYKVQAEMGGFSTATTSTFNVGISARQRADIALQVGSVSETVEVVGGTPLVETESSERGQVIQRQQIMELPLNGRNYADLALLSTGVRRSTLAVAVDTQGGNSREASFNANGLRSTFNNFLLDGIDNNSYGTSNQNFSNQVIQLSPDAVAEFKVVTNNMSAEFGRSGGAVINASSRSGSNQFHASAWEFVRNTSLNAVGFFKPLAGKPILHRNQFGATLGGPIVKNRTFYFADYEGFRQVARTPIFSSLPTLSDRRGIFDKPVRNPLTNETFPANTPITAMSRFARTVLDDLPAPNGPGRANNYQSLPRDRDVNDKMDLKLDHRISDRLAVFGRLSHRKSNLFNEPPIPGPSGGSGNGFTRVLNQQLAVGVTFTQTPVTLWEFRFGISRTVAGKEPVGTGGPNMRELYGITGLPEDKSLTGAITTQNINGFSSLGRRATNPQWQHPFVLNPRINFSRLMGKHSLKAGYEFQRVHTEIQDVNPLYGQDSYSGNFSRPVGGPADSATYNLADFMFGLRNSYALVNFFVAQYSQRMNFTYLQDDYRVNSKLTLNLGVRYEYATPQFERDNRASNYDPATNSIVLSKAGSMAERALINPDRNNWAPRIGFAYSPTRKMAIRGGYGISYQHFNRAGTGNLLAVNGPQVVNANFTQNTSSPANFRTTQQGYPENFTSPTRFDPLLASVKYVPRNFPTAYVQSWFLSIQREIAKDTLVDVGYVGNRGLKLPMFGEYNQARPNGANEDTLLQLRRPIQQYASINTNFAGAFSNYHGLQLRFERRSKKGFYLLQSFTYSKAIDNVAQSLENPNGDAAGPQDIRNLRNDKAVSAYDQTLTSVTSLVWDVPVGKGRRFGAALPYVAEAVMGGWQLSVINNMWSGQPINLRYSPSAQFAVGSSAPRPNLIGDPVTPAAQRTIDNYLNPANVVIPTDRTKPFGDAGRNVARSHPLFQADLGIHKDLRLPREGMRLQFRAEMFNSLNKTNFFPANGDRSSTAFGTIRTTFEPRQVQLALKFYF